MSEQTSRHTWRLDLAGLRALFQVLKRHGYDLIGPQVREGAIVYDRIESPDELPIGITDEQAPGKYRLAERTDAARFGYVVGPQSWKRELYPPRLRLWKAEKTADGGFAVDPTPNAPPRKLALIGVRACELAAIAVHDNVLIHSAFKNVDYATRRENAFLVAVNCGQAGGSCFCVSMNTGPKARSGYDLALTEVIEADAGDHFFVMEIGSERGQRIADDLAECEVPDAGDSSAAANAACQAASAAEIQRAEEIVANTAKHMGREMHTVGIRELLMSNLDHPRWDDVASRCLSCTNCTMVCPTCFCFQAEDAPDLSGQTAEHWRRWDSCFSLEHSTMHGHPVRATTKGRYRQWLTHKLATWFDQFGESGCVGCGRCITWCPVGIDITEEVAAIRGTPTGSETGSNTGESDDHGNA